MSWVETCQSFRGTFREEVSSAEMYVGHARVAKGNEACKRCEVVVSCVGYSCCLYWSVCTLVPEFLLVAFLVSIGYFFYITHCCPS